jgi:hypothetical protein
MSNPYTQPSNKAWVIFAFISTLLTSYLAVAQSTQHPHLPLSISPNKRHLVDSQGKPFLYHADTGWMLFLNLTKAEAVEYLVDRKAKGFNVIQVMLTGFDDFANRDKQHPFLANKDFSKPNEAYFSHVDWVIQQADSLGLILAIAPLWSGCCREGWAGKDKPIEQNGLKKTAAFGQYLGRRYHKFTNLLWIIGGDNDPHGDKEALRQLALGIKQNAPAHLLTYHGASTHSSTDVWDNEPWLDLVMVYTYFRGFDKAWNKNQPDVYEVSYKEYNKKPVRPFILGESTYEGEHESWGSALQARKQAYWAMLSGSSGHAYGSPLWKMDTTWHQYLDLPGATSLKHLYSFFTSLAWEKLVPDTTSRLVQSGAGQYASNDYVTTALASDSSFAVSYLPSKRSITVHLSHLKGRRKKATWFNPRTGQSSHIGNYASERATFNSPDSQDWLLVIEEITQKGKLK